MYASKRARGVLSEDTHTGAVHIAPVPLSEPPVFVARRERELIRRMRGSVAEQLVIGGSVDIAEIETLAMIGGLEATNQFRRFLSHDERWFFPYTFTNDKESYSGTIGLDRALHILTVWVFGPAGSRVYYI